MVFLTPKIILYFIVLRFILYLSMHAYLYIIMDMWVQRLEGMGFPEAGVITNCELSNTGTGNWIPIDNKSSKCS